jgi:hypothetical protein
MAERTRHQDLRSLGVYTNVGAEAVAEHDLGRRHH